MSCPGKEAAPLAPEGASLRSWPNRENGEALGERLRILPHPRAGTAQVTRVTSRGSLWIGGEGGNKGL